MRRALVAVLCALASGIGVAAEPPARVTHEVIVTRDAGVKRVETLLPGPVFDHTVQRRAGHPDTLVLLVQPAKDPEPESEGNSQAAPFQLWRLTPDTAGGPARLVRLRDDVDRRARTIQAWDLDGSGHQTLVTVTPGTLVELPDDDSPAAILLSDAALLPRGARLWRAGSPPRDVLALAGLGRARFLGKKDGQAGWGELAGIDIHKNVVVGRHGLRLDSRPAVRVGEAGGVLHVATPPVPLSDRRLSGHHLAIQRDDAEHIEWWAGLPGPEEVLEDAFVLYDGEPALLVTTRRADKLELFGEKLLRLFHLRGDRSRMGHAPFFAVETRINLWQGVKPFVRDVNGDGVDDLVLAYWKGLKGARIVLDTYLGNGAGGLVSKPRTTAFDVKDADRSFVDFGSDVDGDGEADLLLRTETSFLVFAGGRIKQGRALVATAPTYTATLPVDAAVDMEIVVSVGGDGFNAAEAIAGPPRPRIVDLDQDGRKEVLVVAPVADGRTRLTLLVFGPG